MDLLFRPPIREVFKAELKCYVAPKGTGKSTLQAVLANEYDQNVMYKYLAEQEVFRLNEIGFKKLRVPETLVFSDTPIALIRSSTEILPTNNLDPYTFQLPNNIDKYDISPPYSLYLIDEPHKIWGNRDSATLPERTEGKFWLTRHFDLSMYFFYQEKEGIDKKIRQNLNEYNLIKNMDIKYYVWKKDAEGYRKIKKVIWEIWRYFRYDDFMAGFRPPEPYDVKYARKELKKITRWLPPFCWFHREQKRQSKIDALEVLEKSYFSEIEYKVFKGDPFTLFNTKNFASVQYKHVLPDGQVEDLDSYKKWAENLEYIVRPNPPIKPETLEEFKQFNDLVRVVKPETYTKNNRARKIKQQIDKEQHKKK